MTNFQPYSRRKFLVTAGASAGSLFLFRKPRYFSTKLKQQTPAANINPEQAPETPKV